MITPFWFEIDDDDDDDDCESDGEKDVQSYTAVSNTPTRITLTAKITQQKRKRTRSKSKVLGLIWRNIEFTSLVKLCLVVAPAVRFKKQKRQQERNIISNVEKCYKNCS